VKKTSKMPVKAIPPHDYRPALQGALSWLGKRYLLAEPLNRRTDDGRRNPVELQRA
jgi:hypothetical protein